MAGGRAGLSGCPAGLGRLSYNIVSFFFFFNDTATTEIYTLSLHDALPIFHFFAANDESLWAIRSMSRDDANHVVHGYARRREIGRAHV